MEKLSLREIAAALGCPPPTEEREITRVITDSREAGPGALFIALPGERVDGHDYINAALAAGAEAAVAEHDGNYTPAGRVLRVSGSLRALLEIAALYRGKMPAAVIGITGSVGKTTTKEMVAAVMASAFRIIKTEGNQNNEIGAPKTLMSITPQTQVAVVEMGMSAPGEIRDLCYAARPMMGIITNVGVSHIERLGSRENILKAKLELADALPDGAVLLLCDDNDLLSQVEIPRLRVIRYGLQSRRADITATIVSTAPGSTNFMLHAEGQSWRATIPGTGEHLVLNALAAFGAGRAMGIPAETAIEALKNYTPSGQRQRVVEHEGVTMVEDCYNASPDSMRAAIATLAQFPCDGRRIFVAADMLELGDVTEQSHREIGALCAEKGIDLLLTWGEQARLAARTAQAAGMEARHFEEKTELARYLAATAHRGDVIWCKASHGMALEEVIAAFYREYHA